MADAVKDKTSVPVRDTGEMIAGMAPILDPTSWIFCTTTDAALALKAADIALASFLENEGSSFILPLDKAEALGFDTDMPMARITLSVHSALDGVGLTALVSSALADAGIACNMVAAYHHDHAFLPKEDAEKAMAILTDLAKGAIT